jgi:hypothetical protein
MELPMQTDVHFDCLNANETKVALTLNELQNSGFKICIFGTGQIGKAGFKFLKEKCSTNVDCFCDNSPSKWGIKVFDIPVVSPEELEKNKNEIACVVFNQTSHIEIKKQIVNMGVAHLVPIDLAKSSENAKINKDLEYIKTILLLQNFAPQLLKEMYSGFNISKDLAAKAAPYAFLTLREMDNQSIKKLLMHLINGIGISPETAFDILLKVSKNPAFKEIACNVMQVISFHFPKNEKFSQSVEILRNELHGNSINLWHVSYLLKLNKEQQALSILQKHKKKLDEDTLCSFIAIAEFAHRTRIMKGKKLESLAKVFCALKDNMKSNIMKKLVTGKSVAIVGNGPQELGRKSGVKIDSHDIVVRFNDFSVDEQFIADYGKKTDIHVFTYDTALTMNGKKNIKIFAMTHDPYLIRYPKDLQDFLINIVPLDKLVYIAIPEVVGGLQKDYCIGVASSGARVVYYFKKILKTNLHKNDIFGMALSSGNVENGHYDRYVGGQLKNFFENDWENVYAEFEMCKHLFRSDK